MKWKSVGVLTVALAIGACLPTEVCHDGIWLAAEPADTTLALGETFEPRVRLVQCPDPRRVEARLATDNDEVVIISDGSIQAVGVGRATVVATFQDLVTTVSIDVFE